MDVTDRDFNACQSIVRSGYPESTFPLLILEKSRRRSVIAMIALCDLIQQTLKSVDDPAVCGQLMRERIQAIDHNDLDLPQTEFRTSEQHVLAAAADTIHRFEIPTEWLLQFTEGTLQGITAKRFATWQSLQKYCDMVGGNAAHMLAAVLGVQNSSAWDDLKSIGIAAHLIGIIRNLPANWRGGKLHLPLENLVQFKLREDDLFSPDLSVECADLIQFQIERSRQLLSTGSRAIPWLATLRSRIAAGVMVEQMEEELRRAQDSGLWRNGGKIRKTRSFSIRHLLGARRFLISTD